MRRLTISKALAALCFSLFLLAPNSVPSQEGDSPQDTSSYEDFFLGSGPTFMRVCISPHGNISFFWSPVGYQHIQDGDNEGYVVCGTGVATAYDAGAHDGGWNPNSTFTQPGGPHTLPIIVTRQSADGKLELKQTIDVNLPENEIPITMALKNISGAQITDLKLARYFNGDVSRYNPGGGRDFPDIYDRDSDAVWGKDIGDGPTHHSLSLVALTLGQSHTPVVETYSDYINTVATCTPVPVATVPTSPGDYAGRLTYNLGTLNPGATRTVKYIYRRA